MRTFDRVQIIKSSVDAINATGEASEADADEIMTGVSRVVDTDVQIAAAHIEYRT